MVSAPEVSCKVDCTTNEGARLGKTRQARPEVGPARGVLRSAPGAGVYHHARIAPTSELADVVQHFWSVGWNLTGQPAQTARTLPHPNIHLVFERGNTHVYGIHSGQFMRDLQSEGYVFGVKFRPGGLRRYWRKSMSSLRNLSLPIAAVFGSSAEGLEEAVFAQPAEDARAVVVERFLLSQLHFPEDPKIKRAGEIVDAIAEDRSITAVEQLHCRWDLDKRALQRLFQEYVGVSPKWVISRYRLHEALERLTKEPTVDCATLAQQLGYFDQAHFIRDFKAMVGCSPAAYARGNVKR
jgi:AraC-like DNA-binding protein